MKNRRARKAMEKRMRELLNEAAEYMKELTNKPSPHPVPWRKYAVPGAPPMKLSGTLQGGIYTRVLHPPGARVVGIVGVQNVFSETSGGPYAKYQEEGTKKMEAHPFIRPTYKYIQDIGGDFFAADRWSDRDVVAMSPWGREPRGKRRQIIKVIV